MGPSPLLALALVHLVALASPGPDFLFVTRTAVARARLDALRGVAGIVAGIGVWAAAALLGLELLFLRYAGLQRAVQGAGGLYLIWLGWQLLRAAWAARATTPRAPVADAGAQRLFLRGLLTNLSNAKAVVYFTSVFAGFASAVAGTARWGLWALVVAESAIWFTLVALVFGLPAWRQGYLRAGRWIDAGAGLVFAGFGIHLVRAAVG